MFLYIYDQSVIVFFFQPPDGFATFDLLGDNPHWDYFDNMNQLKSLQCLHSCISHYFNCAHNILVILYIPDVCDCMRFSFNMLTFD